MTDTQRCDVCIVGAGLAGLNALFVASRYLASDQKVILIDRRERVGGIPPTWRPRAYGWRLESDEETDGIVRVTCRSSDGRPLVVETKRLIKAYGFRIEPNDPLEFSSSRVQSVSPGFCDMRGGDMRASDAPVWIVGATKSVQPGSWIVNCTLDTVAQRFDVRCAPLAHCLG